MKRFLKEFVVVTIPSVVILIIVLELIFRFVIPASQQPQNRFDGKELIFNYMPGQKDGTATAGWRAQLRGRWHINNFGWNSEIDYSTEKTLPRIAVIGDSYIDAMFVGSGRDYPALMRKALEGRCEVYSFGISGAPFSEYLHISRYVARHFDPDVMVFNIVMNDFDESFHKIRPVRHWLTLAERGGQIVEIPPRLDPSQSQYSPLKRLIKQSALVRYLFFNLNMKPTLVRIFSRQKNEYVDNTKLDRMTENLALIRKGTDYILERIKAENPDRKILIVMDAPRGNIYRDDMGSYSLGMIHDMMRELCAVHDIELLDLTVPMYEDYMAHHRKFNSPWDNHWDEYGHSFVAGQVLERIADFCP